MKKILSILLLVCITQMATAQLLWEISGNGSQQKSYLFATNKLSAVSFLDSVDNLFDHYNKCKKVVCEMQISDFEALQALRKAALLPDSVLLKNFFTEEEYQTIDAQLRLTLQLGLQELGRMKPAYLTEMYRNELLKKWMGYNEQNSSELLFQSLASYNNTPIYALDETGEALYMLFDREPISFQMKQLSQITTYPEREIQLEKRMLEAYRQGSLNEIAYILTAPDNQSTLSYSDYQVWAERNIVWVKRLQPYLKEGEAFICIDAKYMGGEKGLIAQLRAKGYRVRPARAK